MFFLGYTWFVPQRYIIRKPLSIPSGRVWTETDRNGRKWTEMDENEPKRTDLNRNEPFWTEMDCFSRRNGLLFGGMLCFWGRAFLSGEERSFCPDVKQSLCRVKSEPLQTQNGASAGWQKRLRKSEQQMEHFFSSVTFCSTVRYEDFVKRGRTPKRTLNK